MDVLSELLLGRGSGFLRSGVGNFLAFAPAPPELCSQSMVRSRHDHALSSAGRRKSVVAGDSVSGWVLRATDGQGADVPFCSRYSAARTTSEEFRNAKPEWAGFWSGGQKQVREEEQFGSRNGAAPGFP